MFFRVYCNLKEIEAPDLEAAEMILRNELNEVIWLLPVTETEFAPLAKEEAKVEVKEKKGGHGQMTVRY
ncbi:MAG: hypothetical protein LBQ00_07510 [Syntrophobacterales bacterium]|jgi:hypothetical protein|nr:hypothetical protein [Syntrophobacterales bacterium]